MQKFVCSVFMSLSVLASTGCGFSLRGTNQAVQLAPQYQSVQLSTEDTPDAYALKQPLTKQLQLRGINATTATTNAIIDVKNLRFHRYELVGTLTEIRLVLMADVSYHINGQTHSYPLQSEQSYQRNEASVVITDEQGKKAKTWLYDDLAEKISEQYRALAQNHQNHP